MRKLAAFVLLIASAVVVSTLQSCQSTKSTTASKMLRLNLETGKGYDYEMTTSMDQEVMGQAMKMDMNVYYSMNVLGDNGTNKTISITYDRFKMAMDAGIMNINVDTEKPLPEMGEGDDKKDPFKMINRLLSAIKGRKFTITVNPEGKVIQVEGLQDMANSILDSMGLDNADAAERERMKSAFDQQFNDEDVKKQLERVLYIFPNKEVKVGDSWERATGGLGKMGGDYKSTYTVKEIEGDMVTLDEKSKISSDNGPMEMKGDITGTVVVDSRSGLVVSADQQMDIKAKGQGQSMNIKAVTKIKGKAN